MHLSRLIKKTLYELSNEGNMENRRIANYGWKSRVQYDGIRDIG